MLLKEAKEVSENTSNAPLQAALVGFLPPELLQGGTCPAWDWDRLELLMDTSSAQQLVFASGHSPTWGNI